MIRYLLSKLLLIEAVLLLVPVSVAIYYQESSQVFIALFSTIGIYGNRKINGFMPRKES